VQYPKGVGEVLEKDSGIVSGKVWASICYSPFCLTKKKKKQHKTHTSKTESVIVSGPDVVEKTPDPPLPNSYAKEIVERMGGEWRSI
jgi:hypothetical protein